MEQSDGVLLCGSRFPFRMSCRLCSAERLLLLHCAKSAGFSDETRHVFAAVTGRKCPWANVIDIPANDSIFPKSNAVCNSFARRAAEMPLPSSFEWFPIGAIRKGSSVFVSCSPSSTNFPHIAVTAFIRPRQIHSHRLPLPYDPGTEYE
jgi:hypothetical protein